KKNQFSLASGRLRYKLKISFYLISVLPTLALVYIISEHLLPLVGLRSDILITILISITMSSVGFFLIKQVFDRILDLSTRAKLITGERIKSDYLDEVDDLSGALNQLSQRVSNNMSELKGYSERTAKINLEIQERVTVFSSLMQISSMISQGAKFEDVLRLTVEKSRFMAKSDAAYFLYKEDNKDIFTVKVADGLGSEEILRLEVQAADPVLSKLINSGKTLVMDQKNAIAESLYKAFYDKFKLKNNLLIPVSLAGKVIGIMGIGNNIPSFCYRKDEMELLDIFAKHIAIAIENDALSHRVEKLEIRDSLTALYNTAFMRNRLQEEIKRAGTYQRPCAYIIFDIDNFKTFQQKYGLEQADSVLKKIALLIRESVTEIDRVGRWGDDEFALILPERNKRRALDIAEDIRKKVEFSFSEEEDPGRRITISGGLSENPLDGVTVDELISKARALLDMAKKQGKNCVVSFKEPPVC
ncbi:MAG TPA: sensor domain-containing diguanylate cyclase, partial [Candidatus Margulisiibacteriota bacterium]|nr:sensor domain-containing diguanylate cyclase [Candidatus Margulisiibacteriota bacterium]